MINKPFVLVPNKHGDLYGEQLKMEGCTSETRLKIRAHSDDNND